MYGVTFFEINILDHCFLFFEIINFDRYMDLHAHHGSCPNCGCAMAGALVVYNYENIKKNSV